MFKKRKWIIIGIVATVVVVAVGIIGGAVYANNSSKFSISDNSTAPGGAPRVDPQKQLADKVAGILGIGQDKVEAAFQQAQKELASERSAKMLAAEKARIDKLVEQGKMTKEDAAKIKTWLESKPDVQMPGFNAGQAAGPGKFGPGKVCPGCGPGGMPGGPAFKFNRPGNNMPGFKFNRPGNGSTANPGT
jgi:hypothetical protein